MAWFQIGTDNWTVKKLPFLIEHIFEHLFEYISSWFKQDVNIIENILSSKVL